MSTATVVRPSASSSSGADRLGSERTAPRARAHITAKQLSAEAPPPPGLRVPAPRPPLRAGAAQASGAPERGSPPLSPQALPTDPRGLSESPHMKL